MLQRINERDVRLRVHWQAPVACDMVPPCPYCCTDPHRSGEFPSTAAVGDALVKFCDEHGPCLVNVGWGEPAADRACVGTIERLAAKHLVRPNTNLVNAEAWLWAMQHPHVALSCSFHPHRFTLGEFRARMEWLREWHIQVACIGIVAYPPFMHMLTEWLTVLRADWPGLDIHLLHYGGVFEGVRYPEGYTPSMREIVMGDMATTWGEANTYRRTDGLLCDAGMKYVVIRADGVVQRCPVMSSMPMGTILSDDGAHLPARLAQAPAPCRVATCFCPDLWGYVHWPEPEAARPTILEPVAPPKRRLWGLLGPKR